MRVFWCVGLVVCWCVVIDCISRSSLAENCEFPHHVAIFCYRDRGSTRKRRYFVCGGSFVNSNTVITAAHCVSNGNPCEIQAGTIDIFNRSSGIISNVVSRDIHRKHMNAMRTKEDKTLIYDIALLTLDRNFSESKCIRYADLYPVYRVRVNTTGFFAGWGKDEYNIIGIERGLSKAIMPVQPIEYCNATYIATSDPFDFVHESTHFCCGDGLHESCTGDSGGGLVRLHRGSRRWEIMGIASFQGIRNPVDKFEHSADAMGCGFGYSGMTRVSYYRDWILERVSLPPPPSSELSVLKVAKRLEMKRPICYGVDYLNENGVCGGHGECVFLDQCECQGTNDREFFGEECRRSRIVVVEEVKAGPEGIVVKLSGDTLTVILVAIILAILVVVLLIFKIFCK